MLPTDQALESLHAETYGDVSRHGWRVRMRAFFGYHDSDAWYEATVKPLVNSETDWLDVGGGKSIFPFNKPLAAKLAQRCRYLAVVDPAVSHSAIADETTQCLLEEYDTDRQFDLITMRMVAEHVENPAAFVAKLASLLKPGGTVVLITPNKWSPVSIVAALIPYRFHMPITRLLWNTNDDDVFPTVYKMNTRRALRGLFGRHQLCEVGFRYCDNTTTFHRFRIGCAMELVAWRALRALGVTYPENNLLAVYRKNGHNR